MKIASVVIKNKNNINQNIDLMIDKIMEAKSNKADMVLFSEGELSGRIFGRDVNIDKNLAVNIKSDKLKVFSSLAIKQGIIIGFGFLEENNNKLYNSYILYDKEGEIKVNYKMISEEWHIDNKIYQSGESINCWVIDDLSFSILLGNDCLDEINQSMVNALDVDICFIPRANTLDDLKSDNLLNHHLLSYIEAIKKMNTNVIMINQYLENEKEVKYYGGVTEINNKANIENSLKIKTEGILYTEI
jgi:predicted amidohydrolase